MDRDPHPDRSRGAEPDSGVTAASGYGSSVPSGGGVSFAPEDGGSTPTVAPGARVPLLESSGEFSCPHCAGTIRLEGVGLRFEGAEDAETVQLDLRHPEEPLDAVVEDVQRVLAIRALREANGVKVRAAEIAGMKYTTFYELVRRLGITDQDISA